MLGPRSLILLHLAFYFLRLPRVVSLRVGRIFVGRCRWAVEACRRSVLRFGWGEPE